MKIHQPIRPTALTLALACSAMLLTACGREEEQRSAGQQLDEAIAQTGQRADAAKDAIQRQVQEAKVATEAAAQQLEAKVEDAAITAGIKTELAKDPQLSALRIEVDTSKGRVALRGSAPDAGARDRATRLAMAVKGVMSVDNQLELRS
jgi:osmotically-inducible protein OsmY